MKALGGWLIFVASLRLLSVGIGILKPSIFKKQLYDKRPDQVTDLHGRVFATWTSVTCALCLMCANDLSNKGVYDMTLFSFWAAITHFTFEVFHFRTVSIKKALNPLITAGVSVIWMHVTYGSH